MNVQVVLGVDKESGAQYAIKILERKHIMKENKVKYVTTERDIFNTFKCFITLSWLVYLILDRHFSYMFSSRYCKVVLYLPFRYLSLYPL